MRLAGKHLRDVLVFRYTLTRIIVEVAVIDDKARFDFVCELRCHYRTPFRKIIKEVRRSTVVLITQRGTEQCRGDGRECSSLAAAPRPSSATSRHWVLCDGSICEVAAGGRRRWLAICFGTLGTSICTDQVSCCPRTRVIGRPAHDGGIAVSG